MIREKTDYSVLIRVKNGEKTLPTLIESLLDQSCPPKELIFVNNGSTDQTVEIIEALCPEARIFDYPDPVFNYSKALNLGMALSSSPFVLVISAHVKLLSSEICASALAYMSEETRCAGVVLGRSPSASMGAEGVKVSPLTPLSVSNHAHLISSEAWQNHPFKEGVSCCEDKFWEKSLLQEGWHFTIIAQSVIYDNPHANHLKGYRDQMMMVRYLEEKRDYLRGFPPLFYGLACAIIRPRPQVAKMRFYYILGRLAGKFPSIQIPDSKYF